MRIIRILILTTILTTIMIVGLTSCNKDNPILFKDSSMGFISGDNQITTDNGLTYTIINSEINLDFGTRVYSSLSVIECIDEGSKEYAAKLENISIPECSVPLKASKTDLSVWDDAISVSQAWISGGYLNMYCSWIVKTNSETIQETALVLYDHIESKDTVAFILVHNSKGEGFYKDSGNSPLKVINKLATFPIQEIIPSENVTIKLSWKWHRSDGYYLYPETEEHSIYYSLTEASAEPSTKATISLFTTLLP